MISLIPCNFTGMLDVRFPLLQPLKESKEAGSLGDWVKKNWIKRCCIVCWIWEEVLLQNLDISLLPWQEMKKKLVMSGRYWLKLLKYFSHGITPYFLFLFRCNGSLRWSVCNYFSTEVECLVFECHWWQSIDRIPFVLERGSLFSSSRSIFDVSFMLCECCIVFYLF